MPAGIRVLSATDPLLSYRGAVSLEQKDDGVAPWRVPFTERRLFFPEGGMGRAAMPSGVRVTFRTDAAWVRCRYTARPAPTMDGPPEIAQVDLACDGDVVAGVALSTAGPDAFTVADLPAGMHRIELWLPGLNQFVLQTVELPVGARVLADTTTAPRWVHYGASESQGRGAPSPSRTWPALVARGRGLDLTSLAIGAGCHLQPVYGSLMRDLPADLLTCCVGMNAYGARSLNELSYRANLIGLVRCVREKHPMVPFVVMTHYFSPLHDPLHGLGFYSLQQVREHTLEAVELLRAHGDENLHYLHGPDLVGPGSEALFLEAPDQDQLHLNAAGHEVMAAGYLRLLADLIGGSRPAVTVLTASGAAGSAVPGPE